MLQISADILALSSEPALLAKNGRILFANAAAQDLIGSDCTGQPLSRILGEEIAGVQSPAFLGETLLRDTRFLLRVKSFDGVRAFFLSPCRESPDLVSDAFLFALRNCLMELNVSSSLLRSRAEKLALGELNADLDALTHSFFRINRILSNTTVIRGVEDRSIFFKPQQIDLAVLLRELCDSVGLLADGPELRLSAPESLISSADAALLELLVLNLLSNCLLHAADCTLIHMHLSLIGDKVILSVDDNGRGIPPEALHTVFDRYRHDFSLSDVGRGPGLGLSAARAVARLHDGTLLLESREGVGTAVRVSLGRDPKPVYPVREASPLYERGANSILTGLANCLPDSCFSERYTD